MYAHSQKMDQFGRELRRQREDRGIPVDAICDVTKVSRRHVEALEAGQMEELPGGVFRKGIVRGYLAAIGLEETLWMEQFEASLGQSVELGADERSWVEFAENVKRNRSGGGPPTRMRWMGVVVMLVALLAVCWFAWRYVLRERLEPRPPPATVETGRSFGVARIAVHADGG